ncbi:hypothetical protein CRUP_011598 [Coryphaenoides rupestris]|nr:hypothetical protein CRUP_011598 [Coryphaenoides rupestris]
MTQGDCLKTSTGYITSAVMVGLLSGTSGGSANLVNVLTLAKQSGITVTQTHSQSEGSCRGVCQVEILAGGDSYKASGSVLGGAPVLLELGGGVFRQPVSLTGNLLFLLVTASPQLLPSLAGLLATAGVEIESFSAPAAQIGDVWWCVGLSSPVRDLGALEPVAKRASQITI